jgi:hypothetical protein
MGTAACESRRKLAQPHFSLPVLFLLRQSQWARCCQSDPPLFDAHREDKSGTGIHQCPQKGRKIVRIEVHEAEASTSERPVWVWRVWRNGRAVQGFSPSENDARHEAELAQYVVPALVASRRH